MRNVENELSDQLKDFTTKLNNNPVSNDSAPFPTSYDHNEDLENLLPSHDKDLKLYENVKENTSDSEVHSKSEYNPPGLHHVNKSNTNEHLNRSSVNINKDENDYYYCKRILNTITLSLLLAIMVGFLSYGLIQHTLIDIYSVYVTKTLHFRINIVIFFILWTIMIAMCLLAIIRNTKIEGKIFYDSRETRKLISEKLSHEFYLANLFLFYVLILWFVIKKYENVKIVLAICLFSLVSSSLYFIPYYKIKKSKFSGELNKWGISVTLSCLLALANLLFTLSLIITCETSQFISDDKIELLSFLIHTLIFCLCIIALVFCNDFYYVLVILIFQLGVVVENRLSYNGDNKFTLIYALLTFISLLISVYYSMKAKDEGSKELIATYDEEKYLIS